MGNSQPPSTSSPTTTATTSNNDESPWANVARASHEHSQRLAARGEAPQDPTRPLQMETKRRVESQLHIDVGSLRMESVVQNSVDSNHHSNGGGDEQFIVKITVDAKIDFMATIKIGMESSPEEQEQHFSFGKHDVVATIKRKDKIFWFIIATTTNNLDNNIANIQKHSLLVMLPEGNRPIKITSRKFQLGDSNVELHSIYGLASHNECVVCLSAPSNTTVLPCRHLCLCASCSTGLSNLRDSREKKCPVCRSAVITFLTVKDGETNST
jgi:hypothetical protein